MARKGSRDSKAPPDAGEKELKRARDSAHVQPGVAASSSAQAAPAPAAPAAAAAPAAPAAPAAAAADPGQRAHWVYQSIGRWKVENRPVLVRSVQDRGITMPTHWNTYRHPDYKTVPELRALMISMPNAEHP